MPKKRKSGLKATEFWDVSNWLWEGLDSDDELLIAYNRRPSEEMTSMCALCYQWFKTSDEFHNHMVTHIDTSRFHECSICKKRFLARFLKMRHESIHRYDSNHPFTAYWGSPRGCDFPYDYFVKNHPMKRFKPAPYSPYYLKQLRRLEKRSIAEPISCLACPLQFTNYEELTKHYDLKHAYHECVHCTEVLESFSSYERHLWERHGIRMPVNCRGGRWRVLDELSQYPEGELEISRANVKFFHNYAEPSVPPRIAPDVRSQPAKTYLPKVVNQDATQITVLGQAETKVKAENISDAQSVDETEAIDQAIDEQVSGASSTPSDIDLTLTVPKKEEIEWVSPDGEITYPCQVCGRVFSDERMRNRHRRLHNVPGDKPFECKYCKKAFATHSNRKEHERIHTGERPYKCPVCDRRFIQISNLKKHIQTHKDLNTLKCLTCGKQFVKESSLVLHQRSHATERKFRCEICDRAYNYASLLKRHMRIHTGECPYQCPDCQMPFHELVSLHYHRKKMHTGERPHKCEICGRGFILSSDLKKHYRVHLKGPEKDQLLKSGALANPSTEKYLSPKPRKQNGQSATDNPSPGDSEISDDDDEDPDDESLFDDITPEITLVVQEGSDGDDGHTLHYKIADVGPSGGSDEAVYEAFEVGDSQGVQILSIKEVNGEEPRVLTNGNAVLKSPNKIPATPKPVGEVGSEENFNGEDKNLPPKNSGATIVVSTKMLSSPPAPAINVVQRPRARSAKGDNNNVEGETWMDEQPLLVDDSWADS